MQSKMPRQPPNWALCSPQQGLGRCATQPAPAIRSCLLVRHRRSMMMTNLGGLCNFVVEFPRVERVDHCAKSVDCIGHRAEIEWNGDEGRDGRRWTSWTDWGWWGRTKSEQRAEQSRGRSEDYSMWEDRLFCNHANTLSSCASLPCMILLCYVCWKFSE